jgi:hypothetical protein
VSAQVLANNLWVVIAGLLVFTMTIAVGLLEVGELGETLHVSLLKTIFMTGIALVVMGVVGFNTRSPPTGAVSSGIRFTAPACSSAVSPRRAGRLGGRCRRKGSAWGRTSCSKRPLRQ